jgi:hypothetical protein
MSGGQKSHEFKISSARRTHSSDRPRCLDFQSDFGEVGRRSIGCGIASGVHDDEAQSIAFWHAWLAQEVPFLQTTDRGEAPWDRRQPRHLRSDEIVVAPEIVQVARDLATCMWWIGASSPALMPPIHHWLLWPIRFEWQTVWSTNSGEARRASLVSGARCRFDLTPRRC